MHTYRALRAAPRKVDYLRDKYDAMHRHITARRVEIDAENVEELRSAGFVILCVGSGAAKKLIAETLRIFDVPFADNGIGVYQAGASLGQIVRATI